MKARFKYLLLIGFLFYIAKSIGQVEAFEYRTPILEAKQGWNSISLPLEIFSKAKNDLSDIRIYRLDPASNKSIEQAYILDVQEEKDKSIESEFKIINSTKTNGDYSFTLELSNKETVNHINLNFTNQNLDWRIRLEGSMDLNSWSTIGNDYRIVSFKNREINFKYTDLSIPESKFNFYKISFNSSYPPTLKSATWSKKEKSDANFLTYSIKNSKIEEDEELNTTTIEIDLGKRLPVNQIELQCNSENDYYRPLQIEGIVDSFKTEKGWNYRYKLLYKGTVNSVNENIFTFYNSLFQKLRITIKNFDNQPLSFTNYIVKGPNYRLIARIVNNKNLYLCFGNMEYKRPFYDISYFKDKIPEELNVAKLGESSHFPINNKETGPLLKNKWWLWAIMLFVIVLLGTFTIKMLREEK